MAWLSNVQMLQRLKRQQKSLKRTLKFTRILIGWNKGAKSSQIKFKRGKCQVFSSGMKKDQGQEFSFIRKAELHVKKCLNAVK